MNRTLAAMLLLVVFPCCSALHAMGQVPPGDVDRNGRIRADMVAYNHDYWKLLAPRKKRLQALSQQVFDREATGDKIACSHQIMIESRFFLGYTADFATMDKRMDDLQMSLAHPEHEAAAEQQNPADGTWGGCYAQWWERLDTSYDMLQMYKAKGIHPKYAMRVLDRINSPAKLRTYFASVATSDIAHTGRDNRKELNGAYVNLIRLILGNEPEGYHWHAGMREAILDITLNVYRNQQTGWWGETYLREGRRDFVDDLSVTFHILSALDHEPPHMDRVATTLFAVKDAEYPIGWYDHGVESNHNNMDVAYVMGKSWASMTAEQQARTRSEIGSMLHWCLSKSLQPDGSFLSANGADDSIEEAEHFGANFLSRIGYFDKKRRFWTEEDFPGAEANKQKILAFIRANQNNGAAGGAYYSSAVEEMMQ